MKKLTLTALILALFCGSALAKDAYKAKETLDRQKAQASASR